MTVENHQMIEPRAITRSASAASARVAFIWMQVGISWMKETVEVPLKTTALTALGVLFCGSAVAMVSNCLQTRISEAMMRADTAAQPPGSTPATPTAAAIAVAHSAMFDGITTPG